MNLYLGLNLIILSMPLALSFDKRVAYFRRWLRVFLSAAVVGFIYLVWDIIATRRGDWSFNYRYTGTFRFFDLPLGEYLFFFTVPFACLFIYEVVKSYFKGRTIRVSSWLPLVASIAAAGTAVLFRRNEYTLTVLLFTAGFVSLGQFFSLFSTTHFWMFMGISMVPFMIFNGVLTSLPVVEYGSQAVWGVRILSIPLEDFFYCFTLLGLNALVYNGIEHITLGMKKRVITYE